MSCASELDEVGPHRIVAEGEYGTLGIAVGTELDSDHGDREAGERMGAVGIPVARGPITLVNLGGLQVLAEDETRALRLLRAGTPPRARLEHGEAPAAALRFAQMETTRHRRWSAPFYCAGFTLQGDWRSRPRLTGSVGPSGLASAG